MTAPETLIIERHEGVLLVRLNRPSRRNALNMSLLREFGAMLDGVDSDPEVRALVVTGNAQAFSAGQDLKEPEPPDFVEVINDTFNRLETLDRPTVAAIDGWCLAGGLELALCCDVRLCSTGARIGDWHARIDSIGGAGATVRLVRLLGLAKAKELVFSAGALEGEAARALGLASAVYLSESLVERALERAKALCVGNPLTIRYAKRSLQAAADLPFPDALRHSLECQHALRAALDTDYTIRFGERQSRS
jgi:enoyl-CoA hydratase/carnithine racemase